MSNLRQEMASPKALLEWCRVTCARYPEVEIKNMSTSFRDGLAFCAIIHKHRPDLIDFSSLSKVNAYQNNKLAFDIAERKLGISALLDPNDMVSTKTPDCLSVMTYLSQYYYFFNKKSYAGLASSRSSHVPVLNNLKKSVAPHALKPRKSSADLESSREVRLFSTRLRTVCSFCFKPVHLIQRRLIDGKVYHRSCFRCKICHSKLLPDSYTKGSDSGSLICTYHITDSKSTQLGINQQIGSNENRSKCAFHAGVFSLGGLAVTSVPRYTKKAEQQDRLVYKTAEAGVEERQERSREAGDGENRHCTVGPQSEVTKPAPPRLPPLSENIERGGKAGRVQEGVTTTRESSELSSPCVQATEGSSRPVPAPRRMLEPSVGPVPTPRTKASPGAGNSCKQNKCSAGSSHLASSASGSPKVKPNHPWLAIVHPGPWTQLPPAPAPVPTPRSKSVSNLQRSWLRPKVSAPNPFDEDVDEVTKPELADQTQPSVEAGLSEDGVTTTVGAPSKPVEDASQILNLDETGNTGSSVAHVTDAAAAGLQVNSEEGQSHDLPRSLSVPAITSAQCQSSSDVANECDQVTSCQTKVVCKENPFDRKPVMPKSQTFQALQSERAPAPGHGYPLIKRKVQTDQSVLMENLQVEMSELDKHLEEMERQGVELERKLRDCKNDKEEEQMLMEWFCLIHEKHVLVCRETELVHLAKQQKLEERQADVEYELRCLLNKPESDWTQEDRAQEQQLMNELVAIIEQRNHIISSLDQDRQREREEDRLFEATLKNSELQKEELKELKKSKGRFKTTNFFKMLNHKAGSTKDPMDKKS